MTGVMDSSSEREPVTLPEAGGCRIHTDKSKEGMGGVVEVKEVSDRTRSGLLLCRCPSPTTSV